MSKAKLFLIDGHALCYRCFYGIPALSTSKGQPTNAISGFIRVIRKIFKEHKPDYMAVCFDSPGKTHRQEKFAEYKIQRQPMPDDLRSQIPLIKEVMQAFKVATIEKTGYEADDIIATIVKRQAKKGLEIVIVSDDKDMYQLARKDVKFLGSKNGMVLDSVELADKLGFDPKRIVDFIGLAGDQSDNIPGVEGIGEVNAKKLINKFGDLESVLKHISKEKKLEDKEKLIADQRDMALFSKELAVLDTAAPIKCDLGALELQEPNQDRLFKIFKDLEFKELAKEYSISQKKDKVDVRIVNSASAIKKLLKQIEKEGYFSFLLDEDREGHLFDSCSVFISAGKEDVYAVESEWITKLKPVFEKRDIVKVTYNIKKMLKVLPNHNLEIKGEAFDVMLAGYLLWSSQSSSELNNLAWNYLSVSIPEEGGLEQQVQVIQRLYPLLRKDLEKRSLSDLFHDIEMPLAYVLYRVEENGVNLDLNLLHKLSNDCAKKINQLSDDLYAMAGEKFNLNSPKQLSHILFEKLKLPVIKKTKTGFSTNEAVLTILADQHEFPSLILEYRQLAKLKSTYIDALPVMVNPKTGRIHAQFNQTGTETGRLSSSQPNLQNIPIRTELGKQIRKAIIPSKKDLIMIAADYSQIELRILAHLSKDKNLIKAFKDGEDIHNYTASLIFDVEEDDVTSDMRNSAKRVNFGIIYGISAFGLANDLKVTQLEAQEFINRYFSRYPDVKGFIDKEIKLCEDKGYVLTLLNRRRYIPEIKSDNKAVRQFAQRQAMNTPVQGSAADLMKLAMISIQKEIDGRQLKSRMISTVHDELVFEVPVKEKKEMVEMIRQNMEHAVKLSVPIVISIKAGKNWLDMKEI